MAGGRGAAWRVRIETPAEAVPDIEAALAGSGGAIASGLPGPDGRVAVDAYLAQEPKRAEVAALLAAAARAAGIEAPGFAIERLPDIDWVAEGRKALAPFRAGPFYLHGGHVSEPPPAGAIALEVEAGVAFGTGRHETTRGCLLALARLKRERGVARALDMGCGTGILALAAAKLWGCPVVAVDHDPDAVRLARETVKVNGAAGLVQARHGDGYRGPAAASAPYDLIVANILAGPLRDMAPELRRSLAPGGVAVLSGLLTGQAQGVLDRHKPLRLVRDYPIGEWITLVVADQTAPDFTKS